jgi:EAL domain-containing protein (putative c-di-GMP-specific phosphodiesterase class I)
LAVEANDTKIICAIVTLSLSLVLSVIAKGVEYQAQLVLLIGLE